MEMVEKIVDDHKYEFSIFGAKKALKVLARLTKIIGEPMARAAGALNLTGNGPKIESGVNVDALGDAVKALCEKMDEDNVLSLLEDLCGESAGMCDGKKIFFDTHYSGRPGHLFKVARAALEVQYGDFFDVFKGSLGSPARDIPQAPPT